MPELQVHVGTKRISAMPKAQSAGYIRCLLIDLQHFYKHFYIMIDLEDVHDLLFK